MKALLLLIGLLGLPAAGVHAGTIVGVVRARGKAGTEPVVAGANYSSRKFKFAERIDYAELRDFVVSVVGAPATNAGPAAKPVQVVTSRKITQ